LKEIIEEHRQRRQTLFYSSAFTIAKEYRKDRALPSLILELVPALTYSDILEDKIVSTLGGSALRFKTRPLFERWGYRAIQKNGVELGDVYRPSAAPGDYCLCMMLKEPTAYTKECYFKHQKLIRAAHRIAPAAAPVERREAA
jgi:hypothetical protein